MKFSLRNLVYALLYISLAAALVIFRVEPVVAVLAFYGLTAFLFRLESFYSFAAGMILFVMAGVFFSSQSSAAITTYIYYGLFFWAVGFISFINRIRDKALREAKVDLKSSLTFADKIRYKALKETKIHLKKSWESIIRYRKHIILYGLSVAILTIFRVAPLESLMFIYIITTYLFKIESGWSLLLGLVFVAISALMSIIGNVSAAELFSVLAFYLLAIGVFGAIFEYKKVLR